MPTADPEDKRWPRYNEASRDATFAIGIIATQYARLEWVFAGVFGAVTGAPSDLVKSLMPKILNPVRLALIKEVASGRDYESDVRDRIAHFVAGYDVLASNRNVLMHSQITTGGATTSILLKTERDGKTVGCQVTVAQLREIADQMEQYLDYGMALANHISHSRDGILLFIQGATDVFPLPDKPPMPQRLQYKSGPIRYR